MSCKRCGECCYFEREWVDGRMVNSEPCPFLAHEDELAVCTIYDKRPDACRYYSCDREPLTPDKEWDCRGLKRELESMVKI